MLKFFRTIRKNLLGEGHIRKYLVYAIGEILLVMIGILLALQVSNWNDNRKNTAKSNKILKEIKRNVEDNIRQTNSEIEYEKSVIASINIVLDNLDHVGEYHDSLAIHFHLAHIWSTANWKSSGYQTLKAHGVDQIDSDAVKEAIVDLYEISYTNLAEVMRTSEGYSFSMVAPLFTELFRFNPGGAMEGARPFDYSKLLASDKFKGIFTYWRGLRYYAIDMRTNCNENGRKVVELIEKELGN